MQIHTYCQETLLELFDDTWSNQPKPLRTMLSLLIVALLENNKAHPSVLAEYLAITGITVIARIPRIRRFLSNEKLSPAITVVPMIRLIRPLLSNAREIVLAMDRTDRDKRRKHVNILSMAICYKRRAIPVFWIVLDRKGNSSF